MYALVDCNSFFCSVEKAFHPGLRGKPVVVLSSNDGCVVALTPEAKKVGIKRGDPIFKQQDVVRQYDVKVFSTNMTLYAAMSRRIVSILRQSIEHTEVYSIDESFCDLNGYEEHYDLCDFMREIADRIKLWTDIPVSVGIAPTKTLAKICSKFAKKYPGYRSVCMMDTEEKRRKALSMFDLGDVWGIGRQTLAKLYYYGVGTSLEFADKPQSWVKSRFNVNVVRTWMELNGIPCIDTSETIRNKSVCTSRSFGEMVRDKRYLIESVSTFAASCANKLRGQGCVAGEVGVFVASNSFREDLDQYRNYASMKFLVKTSDTIEITKAALQMLDSIYRDNIFYKKAGVILLDVTSAYPLELNLFDPITNRRERSELMKAIDDINQRYGVRTIMLASQGGQGRGRLNKDHFVPSQGESGTPDYDENQQPWAVKCENKTPNYLTDVNELLVVK